MVSTLEAATAGLGVYTLAEAARYARMPQATLNRWFFGGGERKPLRQAGIERNSGKLVTFVDFVEALAIRSLRADHGVPLQRIKEAIRNARNHYGIDHPFAHREHRTVLVGKDLHIFLKDDPANPVGLTGRDFGQKSMTPCIEAYMKDLEFDEQGLAKLYRAYTWKDQEVVMNPKIHFGEPALADCGYTAETLWQAAVAEGSTARAAELYEVPESAVEAAYRYWNQELGTAA